MGQAMAMPIIKTPDSKTNDLHRFYQQRTQIELTQLA